MSHLANIKTVQQAIIKAGWMKVSKLRRALVEAGHKVMRESLKIVPVDYGILKASWFVRDEGGVEDGKIIVTAGYSAKYAVFVHENLDARHGAEFNRYYAKELAASRRRRRKGGRSRGPFRHSRGEKQQAKFLEQPFRDMRRALFVFVGMRVRS